MDVIGFLCASLGSSTVQLQDSGGSRLACACSEASFCSQNATVLVECTTEEQSSVVLFFVRAKGLNAKDIHKEILLFTVGSVCRVKRFTTGPRNVGNVSLMTKGLKRKCGSG
jgi:hypothetical protein